MEKLLQQITNKKKKLDQLSPLPHELEQQLDNWLHVELTYSSNAIEGNTLTRIETAEIIEKGVSAYISGKSLKDQLEARNHDQALDFVLQLAREKKTHRDIAEEDILAIHRLILKEIEDEYAGRYRDTFVGIRGSDIVFPRPQKIPHLMEHFVKWLQKQEGEHPVMIAANAHIRLVTIHPFVDGNGRASRLLMNLILAIHGYPVAVIRAEERAAYIATVYEAQKKDNLKPFHKMIAQSAERSLDYYIAGAQGQSPIARLLPKTKGKKQKLLKIGELAKTTDETIHTLRHWTKQGLLTVSDHTQGGYQLYSHTMIDRAREIRSLQTTKRMTLSEIKQKLKAA